MKKGLLILISVFVLVFSINSFVSAGYCTGSISCSALSGSSCEGVSGCTWDSYGPTTCSSSDDCVAYCTNGKCACYYDSMCASGETCVNGYCESGDCSGSGSCSTFDHTSLSTCQSYSGCTWHSGCLNDGDCDAGKTCEDEGGTCSGSYLTSTKVKWTGTTNFPWTEGVYYNGDLVYITGTTSCLYEGEPTTDCNRCDSCNDAGRIGYEVIGSSWYQHTCVKNNFIWCWGVHWSQGSTYVRSAYASASCSGLTTQSSCTPSGCTWNPIYGTCTDIPCTETCANLGYDCGIRTVCGVDTDCGTCPEGETCSYYYWGAPYYRYFANCVCTDNCSSLDYQCGDFTFCGVSTNCGTCQTGYTCSSGQCILDCTDTCSSLGYQCGTQTVCGISTDCGTCIGDETCENGQCTAPPPEPVLYWADEFEYEVISPLSVAIIPHSLKIIIENSGITPGQLATFNIKEKDSWPDADDLLWTASAVVDDNGKAVLVWSINSDNLTKALEGPNDNSINDEFTFYFEVAGETSEDLLFTYELGYCDAISLCADYLTSGECSADVCDIKSTFTDCGADEVCLCEWGDTLGCNRKDYPEPDIDTNVCVWCIDVNSGTWCDMPEGTDDYCNYSESCTGTLISNSVYCDISSAIGSCTYLTDTSEDVEGCEDDGYLSYNWGGSWNWNGVANSFTSNPDATDFIESPIGTWRYDPLLLSVDCDAQGGTSSALCPAQIELPFLGTWGILATIGLIVLIYVAISLKKHKPKKRKKK